MTGEAHKVLVVGAGLSGAVIAEHCAREKGMRVTVIDKRDHVGGNCFDYLDADTGIRVSKYGAHIFHTKCSRVWDYISRFTDWVDYEHRVLVQLAPGQYVPMPVNIATVNAVFGLNIQSTAEMQEWLSAHQKRPEHDGPLRNGKEAAEARVGEVLYKLLFREYTKKQWDKFPEELDASVLERIPVRDNHDDRYFTDEHQALPAKGYTAVFEAMLEGIEVRLNTDYFAMSEAQVQDYDYVFFTGPIDVFFKDSGLPKLEYRSVEFTRETLAVDKFQPVSVVNYPTASIPYTRTVEYKHFPNQPDKVSRDATVVIHETTTGTGDPYYPVPNDRNRKLYAEYQNLAEKAANSPGKQQLVFVGRLATYKYMNMDQAIASAMDAFHRVFN